MKRKKRRLEIRGERLREIGPIVGADGGMQVYTTTADEACSGPCCTKVTVSWCAGKGGA